MKVLDFAHKNLRRVAAHWKIGVGILLVSLMGLLVADFVTTSRVLSISETTVNPRGGEIRISYGYRAPRHSWVFPAGFHARIEYPEDTVEVIRVTGPTRFNKTFTLSRRKEAMAYEIFGLFRPRDDLTVRTVIDKVTVETMAPSPGSKPAPETMNNQIMVRFSSPIYHRFPLRENIPPAEIPFAKLTPAVVGYYRFSDARTLTFNFTEDRPQFETTYTIDLVPDDFLNQEDQVWADASTSFSFTTAPNEVYVTHFSIVEEARWNETLTIEFSGAMVGALSVLKEKRVKGFPVRISPRTPGTWVWTNARTLEFRPNTDKGGWPIRKNVTVTVDPKINKEKGRAWRPGEHGDVFKFFVPPIPQRISSLTPAHEGVELDAPVVTEFSREMVDRDMILRPFPSQPANAHVPLVFEPNIKGKFIWIRPDTVKFAPADIWNELTEYRVRLNPKYKPDNRYEWEGTTEFKFKTVENILRYSAYWVPEDGLNPSDFYRSKDSYTTTTDVKTESRLWIEFDRPAGTHWPKDKSLDQALRFEPAVKGNFTWLGSRLLEFIPENDWPETKEIKVTATQHLFWHEEQHFPKGQESVVFKTAKNQVQISRRRTEKIPPDQAIMFRFSRNMNTLLTVGKTYELGSVNPDSMPITINPMFAGQITWPNARTLKIEAADYLKPRTEYSIVFKKTVLPRKQSRFAGASRFDLETTTNNVRISSFTPTGQVRGRITFDAHFTKRIKPRGVNAGAHDTSGLFRIEPAVKGSWVWVAENKLQLKPEEDLKRATPYTVTFDPTKIANRELSWTGPYDKQGQPKPVTYRFNTPPLRIQSSRARQVVNEDNPLQQRFYIDFDFSEPVHQADLKAKFSFWFNRYEKGGSVEVPIIYKLDLGKKTGGQKGYDRLSVVSDWLERPAQNRSIYYRIAGGLKPVVGELALERDYQSDFLQEKPRRIAVQRFTWDLKNRIYAAQLVLNAPVTPERLEKVLEVRQGDHQVPVESVTVAATGSRRGDYAYAIEAHFEPDKAYSFVVPEATLATDGAFAAEDLQQTSTVPHLPTELDFALPGHVLAKHQLRKVPIVTTNRDEFRLYIHKVYPNNVRHFLNHAVGRDISDIAKQVYSGTVKTEAQKDEPSITHVNLAKLFDANVYGMYRICVGDRSCQKQKWFIATDIGLMARRFGEHLVVWARSLNSVSPLPGVDIAVVDTWNQTIAKGTTDGSGLARFRLAEGQIPTLVTAKSPEDLSFISMSLHRDPLKGFEIEGISAAQENLRTFLYSDRGVYRPGETVHLVAVTRAQQGRMPNDYPLEMTVQTPQGVTVTKERFRTGEDGVFVYNLDVSPEAKTGRWKVGVSWRDKNIGSYQFQVEEFVPAKLKLGVESEKPNLFGGEELSFKVAARNLFGPPAAGNEVRAKVQLRANFFKPPGFENYWFGHEDLRFQRIDKELESKKLDNEGHATFAYQIPTGIKSPIGLQAHFSAEVIDDGGRAVAAFGAVDVFLHERYVGIRKLTEGRLEIGNPIRFDVVNVFPSGERVPMRMQQIDVRAFLEKEVTHYKKDVRGYYQYVNEKELQPVVLDEFARDEQGKFTFIPEHGGNYLLEIEDRVGGQITRNKFYVRDTRPDPLAAREPDRVQVRLLDKRLKKGGSAQIEIRAPFSGTAMLLGEKDDLVFAKTMAITPKPVIVTVPLDSRHLPNFYLTATVIRGTKDVDADVPICATGLLNIPVVDPGQKPSLAIDAPRRVNPNGELKVSLKVGDTNNSDMFFTVAVVDEGILSLTGFQTPDMDQYFNQKQRLEVEHFRMYGMVVPWLPDAKAEIYPSGDAPARALIKKRRVNPAAQERVRSVALWSGLQKANANGMGEVSFTLPDFDGQVRVMAVAFGDNRFVSGEKDIVVRDKLVMKPSLPRFAAAGDQFEIPFKLFNGTGAGGDVTVRVDVSKHLSLIGPSERKMSLLPEKTISSSFLVKADHWRGVATVDLVADGIGEQTKKHFRLPLRAPGHLQVKTGSGVVDKNAPVTLDIPAGFVEESEQLALKVSSDPLVRFQNSMRYLVRYPHGCLEQTTSKAFPLLHYASLAKDDLGSVQEARRMVRIAIGKLQQMQDENGAFAFWPGASRRSTWASTYVAHFLVEAKRANFEIGEATWNNMMVFLNRIADDRSKGLSEVVYALYVLALAEDNVLSKLNYTYDGLISELQTQDKARLAAAFAVLGQPERAKEMLAGIDAYSVFDSPYRRTGGNFGSHIRDVAITLDAMVEAGGAPETTAALATQLINLSSGGRWGTTQENAFGLLALGKMFKLGKAPRATATVKLGNSSPVKVEVQRVFRNEELRSRSARIEARGTGELSYTWEVVGLEKNPESLQKDEGLRVRRAWKDAAGKPVDLNKLQQGDVVVAEIKLRSERGPLQNIVVTDLLPAGLEVENARLKTSAKLQWLAEQMQPDYVDIRDDRINIYASASGYEQTFYYAARVVSVGRFTVPPIRAEAMYDPTIFSEADNGKLRIIKTGS